MSKQLVNAVKSNNLKLAEELIAKGADVNQTDSRGNSLLIVCAADGYPEMAKLLIDNGADLKAVDSGSKATALHAAAYLGNPDVMQVLVDNGIDMNYQGPYNGYTALHDAVWQSNVEGVRILVDAGADQTIKGNNGSTPLDLAKSGGKKAIIDILEGKG